MSKIPLNPTSDALYRIKRGLSGYISYLAACEMNEAFSEYVLYEPTLRILSAQGFSVKCEVICPGFVKNGPGDYKKLDFVAAKHETRFAMEMKWARSNSINVSSDVDKLKRFCANNKNASGFLCIFGRKSTVERLESKKLGLQEQGKAVYAEFGITRYGCRIFRIAVV